MARTKVVITAEVKDPKKWERGFRTHGDLFKSQTVKKPIDFAISGNHVAVCAKPDDLDTFMEILDSPATAEAMEFDGVKRETVRVFVLDKEFKL
jgi:carotenoid cleavage dioxygenase-like enzyme